MKDRKAKNEQKRKKSSAREFEQRLRNVEIKISEILVTSSTLIINFFNRAAVLMILFLAGETRLGRIVWKRRTRSMAYGVSPDATDAGSPLFVVSKMPRQGRGQGHVGPRRMVQKKVPLAAVFEKLST